MQLGAFSISLAVADLGASRAFYEKLGFEVTGGDMGQNYLIMVNGSTMFRKCTRGRILPSRSSSSGRVTRRWIERLAAMVSM